MVESMIGASRRKARLPRKILRVHHSDGKYELQPQENGYDGSGDDATQENGLSPQHNGSISHDDDGHGKHSPLNGFENYEKRLYDLQINNKLYANGHHMNGYAGEYLKEATKIFMKSQDQSDYVVVQPCYDFPQKTTMLDSNTKIPSPKEIPPKILPGERKREIPNLTRKHHHPEPTPEYPYQCETCDMLFKTIELLTDHQKSLHDNNRQFSCRYCSKKFNDKYNMRKHVLIHVGEKRHKCHFCDKAFLRKDHLRSHLQTHYNRKYGCKICGKSFRTIDLYQRHAKTHKEYEMVSNTNGNGMENGDYERSYGSPVQSNGVDTIKREHSPTAHREKSPTAHSRHVFKCGFCKAHFEDSDLLMEHERQCKPGQKWQCTTCNIVFDESLTLKQHYERVHLSTEKQSPSRWRCKTCDINYPNSKELSRHYSHAHKDAQIFPCSECPKTFTVWHNLKKHMLIHLGDKKHKCTVCDKGFVRKDHLNSHMKVHLGDGSKFTCPICSKVFRLKQMYYKHMNLHGLEQAYTQEG